MPRLLPEADGEALELVGLEPEPPLAVLVGDAIELPAELPAELPPEPEAVAVVEGKLLPPVNEPVKLPECGGPWSGFEMAEIEETLVGKLLAAPAEATEEREASGGAVTEIW